MHRLLIGPQLPDHTEDVGEEPDHGKHQRISEVKIEVDLGLFSDKVSESSCSHHCCGDTPVEQRVHAGP